MYEFAYSVKTRELLEELDRWDQQHQKWLFSIYELACLFPQDTRANLLNRLSQAVRYGDLKRVAKGVYVNHRARSRHMTLYVLARHFRPRELIYVSRESRLTELGRISQQMQDYLTLTTTGRSYLYSTPYGRIEYTHTERSFDWLLEHVEYNKLYRLFEASEELALDELRRSGRNWGLVMEKSESNAGEFLDP